ncbi:calmodulin-binding-domain-containing protein [Blastocladiella britannica]|nr:calmodulin-binding-domain-containing protein [Blastocladiella britannica]
MIARRPAPTKKPSSSSTATRKPAPASKLAKSAPTSSHRSPVAGNALKSPTHPAGNAPGGAATQSRHLVRAHPHEREVHIYIPPIPADPFDESVYDLIPIAVHPPPAAARHISRYAGEVRREYREGMKQMASMGKITVVGWGPERYLKKGEGEKVKPEVPKHQPDRSLRKAPLPGTPGAIPPPSGTDFIRSNRTTIGTSDPSPPPAAPRSFLRKANYGRPPAYLGPRKAEQMATRAAAEQAGSDSRDNSDYEHGPMVALPESERMHILDGLRANWDKLNTEYQKLSLTVDTVPKIARKVNMEQQLKKLEEDILRFSHENIYIRFEA